jgi:hypothetical protein
MRVSSRFSCMLAFACCLFAASRLVAQDELPISTSDSNVGYIDSAVPMTQIRFRYDSAYDNPTPDRVQFFYSEDGPGGLLGDETRVDYQDMRMYFEYAPTCRLSAFVEVPVRFLNPEVNANTAGLSDIEAGFKYAIKACPDDYITAQLRVYTPTGDAVGRGLGTGHVSLEPGVLFFRRFSDRLVTEGEFKAWIPISESRVAARQPSAGELFSATVLRYGLGAGYDLWQGYCCDDCCTPTSRLTGVAEFVGWTMLGGFSNFPNTVNAQGVGGDTIVNGKFGARYTTGNKSLYVGYGRALTGPVWYNDVLRAEFRITF